jgi:hypothetical protein
MPRRQLDPVPSASSPRGTPTAIHNHWERAPRLCAKVTIRFAPTSRRSGGPLSSPFAFAAPRALHRFCRVACTEATLPCRRVLPPLVLHGRYQPSAYLITSRFQHDRQSSLSFRETTAVGRTLDRANLRVLAAGRAQNFRAPSAHSRTAGRATDGDSIMSLVR